MSGSCRRASISCRLEKTRAEAGPARARPRRLVSDARCGPLVTEHLVPEYAATAPRWIWIARLPTPAAKARAEISPTFARAIPLVAGLTAAFRPACLRRASPGDDNPCTSRRKRGTPSSIAVAGRNRDRRWIGADVGEGLRHVAGLHRQQLDAALRPQACSIRRDHPHQLLGAVIADIVEPVWRHAAAGLTAPSSGGGLSRQASTPATMSSI